MKSKLIIFLLIIVAGICITSCSTSTKVTFSGQPGTQIYTPEGALIGAIPFSGELRTEIKDQNYYAIMLSKNPTTGEVIPFGMDYKHKSHLSSHFLEGLGYTVAWTGLSVTAVGSAITIMAACNDDEDIELLGGIITAGGVGLGLGGISFGAPAEAKNKQAAYRYSFQYLPNQRTNEDFVFNRPAVNYSTGTPATRNIQTRLRPTEARNGNTRTSDNTQSIPTAQTTRPTRIINDVAKKAQGDYVGSGTISLENEELERINGVTVQVRKVETGIVAVSIIESDGNNFFGSAMRFSVEKNNGRLILRSQTNPSITIMIENEDRLIYMNPVVEIDGTLYTLAISAEKQ